MTAVRTVNGSQLLVCMCGLPARGKTYIAQKGLLLLHLQDDSGPAEDAKDLC